MGNVTNLVNGSFVGISSNSYDGINMLFQENLYGGYKRDCSDSEASVDFFTVFGVVFSGVTGIMAGANLSGELISPSHSIPAGTLSACLLTYTTFIILSIMTAITCDQTLLLFDCIYMIRFTWWKGFILIGVILATWSASLSNMIGASRVLYAVAKDKIFGQVLNFVSLGSYKDSPVLAVLITFLLIQLCFLIGGISLMRCWTNYCLRQSE